MDKHTILDGKVRVYKRPNTAKWHCSARLDGKNVRRSTGEKLLERAKLVAEQWYFTLRSGNNPTAKMKPQEPSGEKTFADAAKLFVEEYGALTKGERHPRYVKDHEARLNNHLLPYFGSKPISEVNSGLVQQYRLKRAESKRNNKAPSRSTLHHEAVTLRQVLKTAMRHGWISNLPDFSNPYRASGKVSHRGWFSKEEYKVLYTATRENVKAAEGTPYEMVAAQLHDKILFMANTGLRPDEVNNLEYRDVEITEDEESGELILVIQVRGKRGVGYCKSTNGAVFPFQHLVKRNQPLSTDRVFPHDHKKQFNKILNKLDLKEDREGNR